MSPLPQHKGTPPSSSAHVCCAPPLIVERPIPQASGQGTMAGGSGPGVWVREGLGKGTALEVREGEALSEGDALRLVALDVPEAEGESEVGEGSGVCVMEAGAPSDRVVVSEGVSDEVSDDVADRDGIVEVLVELRDVVGEGGDGLVAVTPEAEGESEVGEGRGVCVMEAGAPGDRVVVSEGVSDEDSVDVADIDGIVEGPLVELRDVVVEGITLVELDIVGEGDDELVAVMLEVKEESEVGEGRDVCVMEAGAPGDKVVVSEGVSDGVADSEGIERVLVGLPDSVGEGDDELVAVTLELVV